MDDAQPLVRVHDQRVGAFHAIPQDPALGQDHRRARHGRIDVQPQLLRARDLRDLGDRVEGRGRGRAAGRDDRARFAAGCAIRRDGRRRARRRACRSCRRRESCAGSRGRSPRAAPPFPPSCGPAPTRRRRAGSPGPAARRARRRGWTRARARRPARRTSPSRPCPGSRPTSARTSPSIWRHQSRHTSSSSVSAGLACQLSPSCPRPVLTRSPSTAAGRPFDGK